MREVKSMRKVHKQHVCISEQLATDYKPGISWFVAEQGTFEQETHLLSPNRPLGHKISPNLPTSGGGGKRTLRASCKLSTTHASV